MPKHVRTTGSVGVDREIDALWRALDARTSAATGRSVIVANILAALTVLEQSLAVNGHSHVTGEMGAAGDGLTVDWTLSILPLDGTVAAYLDGVRTPDFTQTGNLITFDAPPILGAVVLFDYATPGN